MGVRGTVIQVVVLAPGDQDLSGVTALCGGTDNTLVPLVITRCSDMQHVTQFKDCCSNTVLTARALISTLVAFL